jgi:hypothetical protein
MMLLEAKPMHVGILILLLILSSPIYALPEIDHKTISPERIENLSLKKHEAEFYFGEHNATHLKKFKDLTSSLPEQIGNRYMVSHNSSGSLWAINGSKESVIYDSTHSKILFKAPLGFDVQISPGGKYFLMIYQDEEPMSIPDQSILKVSNGTTVINDAHKFSPIKFLYDDRFVFGTKENLDGYYDLSNPKVFVPMDKNISMDELRYINSVYEIPGKRMLFRRTEAGMKISEIPSMKVLKSYTSLPIGSPCITTDMTLLGSNCYEAAFFYSELNHKTIGFALSNKGEYLCQLKMGWEKVLCVTNPPIWRDKRGRIINGGYWDIKKRIVVESYISLNDYSENRPPEHPNEKLVKETDRLLSKTREWYSSVEGVFPDGSSMWVVLINSKDKRDDENGTTVFIKINNRLEIEKIRTYQKAFQSGKFQPAYDAEKKLLSINTITGKQVYFKLE